MNQTNENHKTNADAKLLLAVSCQNDIYKYRMLMTEELMFKKPDMRVKYIASNGKEFYNEMEAVMYDREISRESYYNHLLKNRNWFMRLFNIKPSMDFYDMMELNCNYR